jgi:hypothetical protein
MSNQDSQHESLRFDEAKSFSENCKAFLAGLETVDAEMAVILLGNWDALVAVVRQGERDSKARSELNSKVASALDSLLKQPEPKGGA